MKIKTTIYTVLLAGLLLPLINNCTKEETKTTDQTSGTVTDIDGNIYHTVTIGTQVWMVENLKVTKYRNGNPIPNVTDNTAWGASTTGAYCNYNNDVNNSITYGRLYNWYAANDIRKIAPIGWHVPTESDWTILITYLGGKSVAGGKLREKGTTHWRNPNNGATNESGFTALPGGNRDSNGTFGLIDENGGFWVSTESYGYDYWANYVVYNTNSVAGYGSYEYGGFSIRCIKD